jgi:hypothetical protein
MNEYLQNLKINKFKKISFQILIVLVFFTVFSYQLPLKKSLGLHLNINVMLLYFKKDININFFEILLIVQTHEN